MSSLITCSPKFLPPDRSESAANKAVDIALAMLPPNYQFYQTTGGEDKPPQELAVVKKFRWPFKAVRLTVGFLDNPPTDLQERILSHMNAWAKSADVQFTLSNTDSLVRIARWNTPPEWAGYWSLVGTDILGIAADMPTMNLQGFTMNTPESEFLRVVRHETGHTLGFPHEHMRQALVDKIDPLKANAYYWENCEWLPDTVRDQVLKPIENGSIRGTAYADPNSIMCYQIPGKITKDGIPIPGGSDISDLDYEFAASIYPKK